MTQSYFNDNPSEPDSLIFKALQDGKNRQQGQCKLTASENTVSSGSLETIGSVITIKTVVGFPGKRLNGAADLLPQAAIDRAKKLFGCSFVNVQSHSDTQANQAVFFALLQPGDTVLRMDLASDRHLSHSAKHNQSGRWLSIDSYGLDRETGLVNYSKLERLASEHKPELIIADGSSYPFEINFPRMREIADKVGPTFLVDMAHFAGLDAAGVHLSPIAYADLVTCTTTKTLCGARGGLV